MRVPALKLSHGVFALGTHDVTSDLVPLGFPSSHFQDSVLCLACSHDSSSCLPRFRLLGPLASGGLGGPLVLVGALTCPSNG